MTKRKMVTKKYGGVKNPIEGWMLMNLRYHRNCLISMKRLKICGGNTGLLANLKKIGYVCRIRNMSEEDNNDCCIVEVIGTLEAMDKEWF